MTEILIIVIYVDSSVIVNGNSPCFSAIGEDLEKLWVFE